MKKLFLSSGTSFLYLVVMNAFLFPIFFPNGPPEMYGNRRPAPLFEYHLLAFFVTAFLMSYLYPLLYKGGRPWKEGLKIGIIMALFVSLPENLHVYAMTEVPFVAGLFPALWVTVIWGIAGIIIALIYGKIPVLNDR